MVRQSLLQVLRPYTGQWDWQLEARCRYLDPDVFFARDNETKPGRIRRERVARRICHECPVQAVCRDYALSVGEPYGVWGGTSEADRRGFTHQPETAAQEPLRLTELYRSLAMEADTESVECEAG
ncbi:WhiB family transcriptional regulator [Rhodococcus sp. NPDC057529]|uniref:WhiB family transcriptional regulator n=1 Tax=Rhodococcus sp. NPDC057529 TaxID=3346158 RepID=UPI0036704D47